MQTCFEAGNDKFYIHIKNKIIYCPHKFATDTPKNGTAQKLEQNNIKVLLKLTGT